MGGATNPSVRPRAGSASDVRIHSRSGHVLSNLVDDQDIDRRDGKPADILLGQRLELFLPRQELRRQKDLHRHQFVEGVFKDCHAEDNWSVTDEGLAHPGEHCGHPVETTRVQLGGTFVVAKADCHHLEQAALHERL